MQLFGHGFLMTFSFLVGAFYGVVAELAMAYPHRLRDFLPQWSTRLT
jgi:hypothetical protein